ncbi:MAG: ComF family protein [Prevotella sp.]|nr:ComF family protein [Prevotella sp.]
MVKNLKKDSNSAGKSEGRESRSSFWTRLFDLISPRLCLVCGGRLAESEEYVCSSCMMVLPRSDHAEDPYDNEMARLFWGKIQLERAAAWLYYQPSVSVSNIVQEMKYRNRPAIGRYFGSIMATEFLPKHFYSDIDALVPLPLAKERERQRGYNQAQEIAVGISAVTSIPIVDNAVIRTHFVESQTRKRADERRQNVEGTFKLANPDLLVGRHVLVVDDVVTTGATMTGCCEELQQVEGIRISITSLGFTHG